MPRVTGPTIYTAEQLGLGGSVTDTFVGFLDKVTMSWPKAKEIYAAYAGRSGLTIEEQRKLAEAQAMLAKKKPGIWDQYKVPIIIGGVVVAFLLLRKK